MALSSSSNNWWEGLAGTVHGSFLRAPVWVDLQKPPGMTRLEDKSKENLWECVFKAYATLSFFFYSPNVVWFAMTVVIWQLFPYPLEQVRDNLYQVWIKRMVVNLMMVWLYYGFWHALLYVGQVCHRPFAPNRRKYRCDKVFHNVLYTSLGSLQWSCIEVAFMYCYATGRLLYMSTAEVLASTRNVLYTALWVLLVVIIRDVHFYFGHRIQHTKFLYKYMHALHHRNSDIEPFSGMAMHPTEHLYYFTCYGPLLFFGNLHPIACMWMGIHVTLSPAAAHSGWEDHWQSDLMHYLHHAYFECNYGTGSLPLDQWFGTFKDRFEPSFQTRADAKATLCGGAPEHVSYWMLGVVAPTVLLYTALLHRNVLSDFSNEIIAGILSVAPIAAAAALHALDKKENMAWTKHYLAPFDKNTWFSLAIHGLAAIVMTILPIYQLVMMLLQAPQ